MYIEFHPREQWNPDDLRQSLQIERGIDIPYRINEHPFVGSHTLLQDIKNSVRNLSLQIPPTIKSSLPRFIKKYIDAESIKRMDTAPQFLIVDFALAKSNNGPEIKLIELQGVMSVLGLLMRLEQKFLGANPTLHPQRHILSGKSPVDEMRFILWECGIDPSSSVSISDINLLEQSNHIDMDILAEFAGIEKHDLGDLVKPSSAFNDFIVLNRSLRCDLPFQLQPKGALECAAKSNNITLHADPDWEFALSKWLLMHLDDKSNPRAIRSDKFNADIDIIDDYVLKPLIGHAGRGVNTNPTLDDLNDIENREEWLLQDKIEYHPLLSPSGFEVNVELRALCTWGDIEGEPRVISVMARSSREDKMALSANQSHACTGLGVVFFEL